MSGTGATCACCTSRRCNGNGHAGGPADGAHAGQETAAAPRPAGGHAVAGDGDGAGQQPFRFPGRPPAGRSAGAAVRAVMSRAASPSDLVAAARAAGIGDERVLEAIGVTPRAGFVPGDYVTAAYRDEPIPIGHRQVTTQPSLSARMIEGLHLAGGDHLLEIGAGLGFQTALLARLAASVMKSSAGRTWLTRRGGTWPGRTSATRRCSLATAAADCLRVPRTMPSWSRPRSRRSPRRWQRSSGSAAAWCSQSGRAGVSRWCCSSVPHPGWSGGMCSPGPGSSGCTGATDSSPGPDRARTLCLSHRRARACSPATCLRPPVFSGRGAWPTRRRRSLCRR